MPRPTQHHHRPARLVRDQVDVPSYDDVEIINTNGRMIFVENLVTGERDWIAPADFAPGFN